MMKIRNYLFFIKFF